MVPEWMILESIIPRHANSHELLDLERIAEGGVDEAGLPTLLVLVERRDIGGRLHEQQVMRGDEPDDLGGQLTPRAQDFAFVA